MASNPGLPPEDDAIARHATHTQVEHFRTLQPRCRVMQLPEGLMIRYTLADALYFYLRTGTADGRIVTAIYATDSPYDPKKSSIGEVRTPRFEAHAEANHLRRIEAMLTTCVDF